MAAILGQSGYGDGQSQFVQHFLHSAHLSLSTVGDEQVGQGGTLFDGARVASSDDLLHRGIIVRTRHGFDVVFPIVFLRRAPFDEDHATRHGVCALRVRVVEALDADGQAVQVQHVLDFLQQAGGALFGIQFFGLLQAVGLVLFHVQYRQLQQRFLFAALGDGEGDILQFHAGVEGHDDFARTAFVSFAHFRDAQRQQFFFAFVQPLFVFEGERLVYRSVRDVQVIDEGRFAVRVFFDGKDVYVVQHVAHHLGLGAVVGQQHVFLLHLLRFLEFHFRRQILHLLVEHLFYFARVALQYLFDLGDVFHVFIARLLAYARSGAILDVILQADVKLACADVLRRKAVVACP